MASMNYFLNITVRLTLTLGERTISRNVVQTGHIILIPSQPIFATTLKCCMCNWKAADLLFYLSRFNLVWIIYLVSYNKIFLFQIPIYLTKIQVALRRWPSQICESITNYSTLMLFRSWHVVTWYEYSNKAFVDVFLKTLLVAVDF